MLFGVFSKLNNAIVCADIGRAIVGQQVAASVRNSGPTWFSVNTWGRRRPMAASVSKPVFGDVHLDDMISNFGNGVEFAKPGGVYFTDIIHSSCQKATISMRSRKPPISRLVCGYSMVPRNCDIGPLSASLKNVHTASPLCFAAGAAHDLPFDGSSLHEQPLKSTVALNQTLKLLSGSCYLPHPDKEETGGEDAHFICVEEQAIGVADGVGGWADVGINSGIFSRELMSNSVAAIQVEPEGSIDPARVLEKAHSGTKAKGSSTACIIALTEKGLNAVNLGDSGFIVVRDGSTIFQSPVQQHGFNFTYQLESGSTGDLPSSGQVFTISVAPGDVVIAGTDGLFDNLYNNEVTAAVVQALKEGLEPQQTAQKIAALARQRAQDRYQQTPFSTAAQHAGFRYCGGFEEAHTYVPFSVLEKMACILSFRRSVSKLST